MISRRMLLKAGVGAAGALAAGAVPKWPAFAAGPTGLAVAQSTDFHITAEYGLQTDPSVNEKLLDLVFSTQPVQDLTARADGIYGSGRWNNLTGLRPEYEFVQAFWDHNDPLHHDFIPAIRIFIAPLSQPFPSQTLLINSKNFAQNSGLPAYPYERRILSALLVDTSLPGAELQIFHHRPDQPRPFDRQLLAEFRIEAVSSINANVRSWYQRSGIIIWTYQTTPVLQGVFTAVNHAYQFAERRVPTAGISR